LSLSVKINQPWNNVYLSQQISISISQKYSLLNTALVASLFSKKIETIFNQTECGGFDVLYWYVIQSRTTSVRENSVHRVRAGPLP
jgi:hypothetical protein